MRITTSPETARTRDAMFCPARSRPVQAQAPDCWPNPAADQRATAHYPGKAAARTTAKPLALARRATAPSRRACFCRYQGLAGDEQQLPDARRGVGKSARGEPEKIVPAHEDRRVDQAIGGTVGGGQGLGVFAEQVVQLVAAGSRLCEQMLVIQLVEVAPGGLRVYVVEGGSGVGAEAGARGMGQAAEQPLQILGEVGVGQAERQRQVPAQPGEVHRRRDRWRRSQPGRPSGPAVLPPTRGRRVQGDHRGVVEGFEPSPAGDQDQAARVPGSSGRTCSSLAALSRTIRVLVPARVRQSAARSSGPRGMCAAGTPRVAAGCQRLAGTAACPGV